jgi:hypothetical protein
MVNKEEAFSFHCQTDDKLIGFLKANNNEINGSKKAVHGKVRCGDFESFSGMKLAYDLMTVAL